jgi:ArsR family metal-binding transcriptional regulator
VTRLEFVAVKPCRFDAYEVVPKGKLTLDLEAVEESLKVHGYQILSNPRVMLVVKKSIEITVYPHGRLLMHPVKSREEAERLARELFTALGR